jgi:hypothetical protein
MMPVLPKILAKLREVGRQKHKEGVAKWAASYEIAFTCRDNKPADFDLHSTAL